ncbi:PAS-domain containing protein [Paracoccus sp. p4-l81]|uniref:PAS-domain containing protein n=1 Tax=Paracoccus sp. p4-l81 TaxID=3342806 RepID=UPI0035B74B01
MDDQLILSGLNLIQQALSIFDSDLRLRVCNRPYRQLFDLPDRLVRPGASFQDTVRYLAERGEYGGQDDLEAAVQLRVDQARAFQPHYLERQRPDGRWISVEGAPLAQGGWVAVYTDITDIKRQEALLRARSAELSGQLLTRAEELAEANRALAALNASLTEAQQTLTETEARTRLVTQMVPAHIAHMDRAYRYTFSNRRLNAVMPGSSADVVGMTGEQALGRATFDRIRPQIDQALAGRSSVFEISHDPSGRRIRIALTPDPGPDGAAPVGVFVLSTDVTVETQARAALAQAARRQIGAQLTSGLAHDFANLLTVILGLQGRLARVQGLPPEAADLAAATLSAARRGGTLLDRIATITGKREITPQPVDLSVLLEDLAAMARPTLGDGIRLSVTTLALPGPLLLDPGALQDSLLNLLLNARDAIRGATGEASGRIGIVAAPIRDTWIEIIVTDSGPGFSDEALDRGMEPFFTTKGGGGSGLGLSMVYDQTVLAGGTVRLGNSPDGGGEVRLRLPLRPAPHLDAAPPTMVLLIDDHPDIRAAVRDQLRDLGHSVIEAASVAEARQLADLPGLGMILSDITLPGGETGADLMRDLAARDHPVPRLLMTALPEAHPDRQAAPCPILSKPVSAADLAAALSAIKAQP